MNDIVAVILAGGYGTRVKHLLPNLPKPMAPVAGKPFLEWVIRYLKHQGITKIIIATGYLGDKIEEHFKTNPVPEIEVFCCRETEPLGTGGGFINAVHQINLSPKAWLVMNGDSLMVAQFVELSNYLADNQVDGVILGVRVPDGSRYGLLGNDESGKLINFAEKREGKGIINGGVYLFRDKLIDKFPRQLPLSFEYDIFPSLLSQNVHLKVHPVEAAFLDIGTPESLPQAENFILENFNHLINQC